LDLQDFSLLAVSNCFQLLQSQCLQNGNESFDFLFNHASILVCFLVFVKGFFQLFLHCNQFGENILFAFGFHYLCKFCLIHSNFYTFLALRFSSWASSMFRASSSKNQTLSKFSIIASKTCLLAFAMSVSFSPTQ